MTPTSIIERLAASSNLTSDTLHKIKREFSRATDLPFPTNTQLISEYRSLVGSSRMEPQQALERLLTIKPIRSQSGVAIVTLLTMPYPCPGKCIYCPDEIRMPKSYIETEPAAARALRLQFDPYVQTAKRIEMLEGNGHPATKIELIIKGGTWSSYPIPYQQWFIKECFRAINDAAHGCDTIANEDGKNPYNRFENTEKKYWNPEILFYEQKKNETAIHRCIGLTIETRPDFISVQEIQRLRTLGVTRVELGIQTINDTILDTIKRGHRAAAVVHAIKLLKDACFKIDVHLMPGLPGATPDGDYADAYTVFHDERFCPDAAKLYPTVVTPNTELEQWWKQGMYTPYSTEQLVELLARIKAIVPATVRLARVIRDIPSNDIVAGNKVTNLRERVQRYMQEKGLRCKCLRCREVGHRTVQSTHSAESNVTYLQREYSASDGHEYFLSYESDDEKILYAFLRLRFPSRDASIVWRVVPELKGAALIRELHTYGQLVPLQENHDTAAQHKGMGKKLLARAEEIARAAGYAKIVVISGIGVREYYAALGYCLQGTYMVKLLA